MASLEGDIGGLLNTALAQKQNVRQISQYANKIEKYRNFIVCQGLAA